MAFSSRRPYPPQVEPARDDALITPLGDRRPTIDPTAFVVDSAIVVGDVALGPEARLWFGTLVRGAVERVRIGARSNVQDNTTIHVTRGRWPTLVGDGVTIGDANASSAPGRSSRPARTLARSLVLGRPAARVRELTDEEVARVRQSAANYVEHARRYRALGVR